MISATTLEGRLLCASTSTYSIQESEPLDLANPYFRAAGFEGPTRVIRAGRSEIHAALVGRTQDGIVIAIRGSLRLHFRNVRTLIDWLNNFDIRTKHVAGLAGEVHSGFAEALECLWPTLSEELASRIHTGERVYLTGHSKGGAVATLAAARWSREARPPELEVVTFGAPRCGNRTFADDYDARVRHTRYEYQDDLAPLIPPPPLLAHLLLERSTIAQRLGDLAAWGYAPVGTLRFIDWSGNIVTPDAQLQRQRLLHLAKLLVRGRVKKILLDHEPFLDYGYMRTLCPSGESPRAPA